KYADEEDADKALSGLAGRFFGGRIIVCEFSPVTDFREARCRQFDEGTCTRGGYCNFMHIREPSPELREHLEKEFGYTGGKLKGGNASMATIQGSMRGGGRRDDYRGGYGGGDRDRGGYGGR